jgi:DNA-binding CsgD family transcriptional regulator/PAS domain-containing protein
MAEGTEALEAIDLLYQAAVEPELWPQALHKLAEAVGGMGTAMIPITPGNATGLVVSPLLLEAKAEYDRDWWRHDSRVLRIYSRKLSAGVCCEPELFTREEIARDPLRQEFCPRYGMGSFAAQLTAPLPNFVVAFSVMRAIEHGQFERRELKTLGFLGKHAARAVVVAARLATVSQLERTLVDALGRFECGALVVDGEGRVIFANEPASRLVGDGLSLNQGRLFASSREDEGVFARLMKSVLRRSTETDHLEPIALPRPSGRQPLLVQAIPVSCGETEWIIPSSAAALLIVVDPEQDGPQAPETPLRLLGLTRSEARLATLIGSGQSRAEAAETLGIRESTARDTAKQLYAKLDISRQSELVRLVERLAVLRSRETNGEERGE